MDSLFLLSLYNFLWLWKLRSRDTLTLYWLVSWKHGQLKHRLSSEETTSEAEGSSILHSKSCCSQLPFPLVQNRLTHTLEVVIVFQVCNKKKKTSYCEHLVPWHNYVYCVSTMTKQKVFNQLWLKATTTHYLDGWITRVDPPRVAVVRFR